MSKAEFDSTSGGVVLTPLRERWRALSISSAWLRPTDWYDPAVDAMVDVLGASGNLTGAAERLGAARAQQGVGLEECLDDLVCLFTAAGADMPPMDAVRALCLGWSAARDLGAVTRTCTDPTSGLATADYLVQRLGEVYRAAARSGTDVRRTHCLVLGDVAQESTDVWARAARGAVVGEALRRVVTDGSPTATLGDGQFCILLERDWRLGGMVAAVQSEVAHVADQLAARTHVRRPARVWVEGLPRTHARAGELVASLVRER